MDSEFWKIRSEIFKEPLLLQRFFLYERKPPARLVVLKKPSGGAEKRNPLIIIEMRPDKLHNKETKGLTMENIQTLAHTSWNCKYHIVFAPKFRRKVFYGQKRLEIGKILRSLCEWKKITIIEAEVCPDHVHMLLEIPPKFAVSSVVGFLKGKSSLQLYERFPELKFKYKNREFWCRGYYVDTAGKNAVKIANYIKHQLDEDKYGDQLTMLGNL